MRFEFLHLADLHLGFRQYGQPERFNDFGRSFQYAVDYALQQPVRLVLISGDLFHKSAIDPPTLLQAFDALQQLRGAGIAVAAVTGNHDRARYRDRHSWLGLLSELGQLSLLAPAFEPEGVVLVPFDAGIGAYLDIDQVRVYGLPYLGASMPAVLDEMPSALARVPAEGIQYTILMAHMGLEGELPGVPGGIPQAVVDPLRGSVDYLALGHWHKPFERDGWIYNPGSTETCSFDEARWHGGFYHVLVDTDVEPRHDARHIPCPGRPFLRLMLRVDDFAGPEALYAAIRKLLEEHAEPTETGSLAPVVELRLEGVLSFDRSALDMQLVSELMQEQLAPLVARPKDNTLSADFAIGTRERLPRNELEQQVVLDLVRRDGRFRAQAERWSRLVSEIKNMALSNSPPETITETLAIRMAEMVGSEG